MRKATAKYVVDTNVPKIANSATNIAELPDNMVDCALSCAEKIKKILNEELKLVVDAGGEIFDEYRKQLSMSGQPGLGDAFMKWVHDNQWHFPLEDRVTITQTDDNYAEFPNCAELNGFDKSDKKFVAVANTHPMKPPIAAASDHHWWKFKEVLKKKGISVELLCPEHIQKVSLKKSKTKS